MLLCGCVYTWKLVWLWILPMLVCSVIAHVHMYILIFPKSVCGFYFCALLLLLFLLGRSFVCTWRCEHASFNFHSFIFFKAMFDIFILSFELTWPTPLTGRKMSSNLLFEVMKPIAYELPFILFQLATKLAQLQRSASVSFSKSFSVLSTCQFKKVGFISDDVSTSVIRFHLSWCVILNKFFFVFLFVLFLFLLTCQFE